MLHSDRVRQTAAGGEKGHAGESKKEEEQNRNNTEVQSEISLFFPPDLMVSAVIKSTHILEAFLCSGDKFKEAN